MKGRTLGIGWCFWVMCLWPMLSVSDPTATTNPQMQARIVDDATGQGLAARVAITNAQGQFVEIQGQPHAHVQYLGKRWCYVNGSFALSIPDSGTGIEIRRGFETRPLIELLPRGGGGNLPEDVSFAALGRHAPERLPQW